MLRTPLIEHWSALIRVLKYLDGRIELGITYGPRTGIPMRLDGHADADWAGDIDTRQSTTGSIITYGGGPISWRSTKQPSVALSSCEAELISTCEATKTVLWMQSLLRVLDLPNSCATIITLNDRHEPGDKMDHNMPVDPIPHVFNDNQGAIKVAKPQARPRLWTRAWRSTTQLLRT
jgi:hypothetical protein